MIKPYNDNVLVELKSSYKHAVTTDARTIESKNRGLCIALGRDISESDKILKDKMIYFDEWEDTTNYTFDGKKYALIPIEKIKGYES